MMDSMSWQEKKTGMMGMSSGEGRTGTPSVNETCFIRKDHKCGKMFGASKSCFVACPTGNGIDPILEIITEKAAKYGFDAAIAVRDRVYGQDIFCTKICGRIIESKFCLTILDDTVKEGQNIPNPNVYYEYGLMTALNKHIIPLQNEKLKLAFNIQSHDTIKYSDKTIGPELEQAIRDAIKITGDKKDEKPKSLSDKTIRRALETSGFRGKGEGWVFSDLIDDTGVIGYELPDDSSYLYLGRIDQEPEFADLISDLKVLIYRTEKKVEAIQQRIELMAILEEEPRMELGGRRDSRPSVVAHHSEPRLRNVSVAGINTESGKRIMAKAEKVFFGFIVDPKVDHTAFEKDARAEISKHSRYELAIGNHDRIKIGDYEVVFSVPCER